MFYSHGHYGLCYDIVSLALSALAICLTSADVSVIVTLELPGSALVPIHVDIACSAIIGLQRWRLARVCHSGSNFVFVIMQ